MSFSAQEVLNLALVNRARLDPAGEAARFGIDLNEGLAPGTITATSKQPLAYSDALHTAAVGHSQSMLDNDYFDHIDPTNGSTPQDRGTDAGYPGGVGENIAFSGSTGSINFNSTVVELHQGLFVDEGIPGRGHRTNMLSENYQEIGVGALTGLFTQDGTTFNAVMITENYGVPPSAGQFLTGIAYNDTDTNAFYSVGEGRGGISIATTGGTFASQTAGEFAGAIGTGAQTITFSGGDLVTPVSMTATVNSGRNILINLIGASTIETSTSVTALSGVTQIIGLGNIGLTLTGSAANETIIGGLGNDTLTGGDGVDKLFGGAGNDILNVDQADAGGSGAVDGGDGIDTVNLIGNGVVFNLAGRNVEIVNGTAGNDQVDGSDASITAALTLNGLGGNDTLSGGSQGDTLDGGAGDDSLYGNGGADTINGGAGIDYIEGGDGNDTINGGDDNDTIYAGDGNDIVNGDAGNEYAFGGSGNDTMSGGTGTDYMVGDDNLIANAGITGDDTLHGGDDNDTLIGGYGSDQLFGEAGDDALYGDFDDVDDFGTNPGSADTLTGGAGRDFMFGGGGNDTLIGGDGDDTLIGGSGDDRLQGDGGSDSLYGRGGADTFVFTDGWGTDGVWDFTDGEDFLEMNAVSGLTSFGQLTITDRLTPENLAYADVEFNGNHIFVVGVAKAQLTAADFLFT